MLEECKQLYQAQTLQLNHLQTENLTLKNQIDVMKAQEEQTAKNYL